MRDVLIGQVRLRKLTRSALAVVLAAGLPVPIALAASGAPAPHHRSNPVLLLQVSHATTTASTTTSATSSASSTTTSTTTSTAPSTTTTSTSATSSSVTTTTRQSTRTASTQPVASRAGDPGAAISDYKFTPGTIAIHAGDTVTWTNQGPSAHTATASNGSFDTGTLQRGQSASHTFTQAGSFAYMCSLHPFMHGTVVVLSKRSGGGSGSGSGNGTGSGTGSGSGSGSGASGAGSTTSSAPASSQSPPTLPLTGLNLVGALGAALLLLGVGGFLRRAFKTARPH